MAQWQRKLMLQPEWDQAAEDEISVQELAGVVAKRLRALEPFGHGVGRTAMDFDDERDELADEFECLSEDSSATKDDFNHVMESLYDWADQPMDDQFFGGRKVCWVDRFTKPKSDTALHDRA